MSDHVPYEIKAQMPSGLHPEWAEHEIRFTQTFGPKHASSNVIFLTTDELKILNRVVLDRIYKTVHVGEK